MSWKRVMDLKGDAINAAPNGWFFPVPIGYAPDPERLFGLKVGLVLQNGWWIERQEEGTAWDVAEAYMRLGYLPPFAVVEMLSGAKGGTRQALWVLAGARETLNRVERRLRRAKQQVRHERRAWVGGWKEYRTREPMQLRLPFEEEE